MKQANADEYFSLVSATLVLMIVLLSSFMCIQLYHLRRPPHHSRRGGASKSRDRFYSPACGQRPRNGACTGETAGMMPAIDDLNVIGYTPCCGGLGVPP